MLGTTIKKYIDDKGLKQQKVAMDAGLTAQQLSDICCERRKVDALEYFRICKALDVDLDYFARQVEA